MIDIARIATVVPIQGTFDIALARNTLRTKIAQQRWPMVFNARAATALTALGELILMVGKAQAVPIHIEVLEEPKKYGIRLNCRFRLPDKKPIRWEEQKNKLEQAAADTEIQESQTEIEVTAYVWVE
jgi:hypothetical protein